MAAPKSPSTLQGLPSSFVIRGLMLAIWERSKDQVEGRLQSHPFRRTRLKPYPRSAEAGLPLHYLIRGGL